MSKRLKTGGRTSGTPNKRTLEAIEKLEELGCDPIEGMARIAMDESNSIELRAKMLSDLAPYVYPKRRTVDLDNDSDGLTIIIERGKPLHEYTDLELNAIIESKVCE